MKKDKKEDAEEQTPSPQLNREKHKSEIEPRDNPNWARKRAKLPQVWKGRK